jgi:hypothetical protein
MPQSAPSIAASAGVMINHREYWVILGQFPAGGRRARSPKPYVGVGMRTGIERIPWMKLE